tara:strand:+ start:42975 stop:43157 length:183 start_codon:yes stop_codon:yes gene_type:complete
MGGLVLPENSPKDTVTGTPDPQYCVQSNLCLLKGPSLYAQFLRFPDIKQDQMPEIAPPFG